MNASLNGKLSNVKWGEYKLDDLFESSNGDFDIKKEHINGKGEWVITSGAANNGILGKTDIKAKLFSRGTITVDMFGWAFYRNFTYKMVTHARVFSLMPKFDLNEKQGLFLASSLSFVKYNFGFDNMCTWEKIKEKYIKLPTKDGKIDFDFMESIISELEAKHIAELSNYLTASGLNNCELTADETDSINKLPSVQWKEYRMGDLFDKIKTQKLPFQAKDLPDSPKDQYILPCLTSSFQNQGLNYYAPKNGATILKNVISIPSNSDVYRAYFQSRNFTVLSDAYAIRWKYSSKNLSPKQYLFMVRCINKVTDRPIYSHKNKLGGWEVVKNKFIQLPQVNGEIDLAYMEALISAIQKLVIKDVVIYADRKIKEPKEITKN